MIDSTVTQSITVAFFDCFIPRLEVTFQWVIFAKILVFA